MKEDIYDQLVNKAINGEALSDDLCIKMFSDEVETLSLVESAYKVRKKFWGKEVLIHILNNVQNGQCSEDCYYCAQARVSKAEIVEYPMKPDEEIIAEAEEAYKKGAFRYCMVFSGRGPSKKRIEHLIRLIKTIKEKYKIEVCVSPGSIDEADAKILKEAGLDRLNHNLNTSEKFYPKICSSHTYEQRIKTINAAMNVGLQICSGAIIGMGEETIDIINVARDLNKYKVDSIPINFFIPIEGVSLDHTPLLSPEYCIRVLCLFRFLNPKAEIRVAAGRELYFGSLESMAFYPANSLFLEGYLNTKGQSSSRTLKMLKDAGFVIKSEYSLDELLEKERLNIEMKEEKDLHPKKNR